MTDTQPLAPTDAELDELRQANSGRLNFVTFSEFRTIARAALAKWGTPQQEAQEPHGWLYEWTHSSATGKPDATYTAFTTDEAHASKHDNCRAVYTAPQPVEREPLTPEQMDAALGSAKKVKPGYVGWVTDQRREFGRAVERAHGIKGGQHGTE